MKAFALTLLISLFSLSAQARLMVNISTVEGGDELKIDVDDKVYLTASDSSEAKSPYELTVYSNGHPGGFDGVLFMKPTGSNNGLPASYKITQSMLSKTGYSVADFSRLVKESSRKGDNSTVTIYLDIEDGWNANTTANVLRLVIRNNIH